MILTIPDKVSWRKDISQDVFLHHNKNTAKRLLKTHTSATGAGITHQIEPITRELLDWYTPIYSAKIAKKNNPLVIDLYGKTLEKNTRQFFMLTIAENGHRSGGMVFSETDTDINIAYKIFDDNWHTSNLPAGPSLYADYLITEYGQHTNRKFISHGKDRNGYGKTSSIGLAIFKVSLGYKPYLPKKFNYIELDTNLIDCDSLYFAPQASQVPLHGYLFASKETKEKWSRLNSYKDTVSIEWILRT
jgi:hypothetical protein